MGDTTGRKKPGLLRHDGMIVANELRSAFFSWRDRLIAIAVLVVALVAISSALSHRPFIFAATAIVALATAIGAGAARVIERRLDFHAEHGVLAADALTPDVRRHYALTIHVLVSAIVTLCAAVARPAAAVLAPIGYLVGAGISHVVFRVVLTDASPRPSFSLRATTRLLQRPVSGALAAIAIVLPLLLLRSIEPGQVATVVGLVSVIAVLTLTMLDYNVVRFMTESGYSAVQIIAIRARAVLIFLILTIVATLLLADTFVAIVVFGVVLAALIFMTSRMLAYRIYSKRTADTLISICAIVCLSGVAMPMLLPVVVLAILWQLYRQAVRVTWLLT